jgi:hypothetical protein
VAKSNSTWVEGVTRDDCLARYTDRGLLDLALLGRSRRLEQLRERFGSCILRCLWGIDFKEGNEEEDTANRYNSNCT